LIGGGSRNDGVFANMMAKPERRNRRITGNGDDSIYLAPEDAQKDAPPSYTAAQADSVPPYWETTVHLSSSSSTPCAGEMIIDGMPTGILFSFLWNMLVSVSFQFVGFLLTFLLHTTHSAKLGSRAGLGVTLIQYGFALRSKPDTVTDVTGDSWGWGGGPPSPPIPAFETYAEAEEWYKNNANTTLENPPNSTIVEGTIEAIPMSDATSEWLSFLLMTIGWFILLTSLLSFWRVKRWEHSILNSSAREPPTPAQNGSQQAAVLDRLNRTFGLSAFRSRSFFSPLPREPELESAREMDNIEPEAQVRLAQAVANDARLQNDLRSAGLL
jgi:hypothetical protein